jgi:uncharacterized protein YjiS (DUF1127 family)
MWDADVILGQRTDRMVKSGTILRRLGSLLRHAIAAAADAWQARRDQRALMAMPDHLLKDIGFVRDSYHGLLPPEDR